MAANKRRVSEREATRADIARWTLERVSQAEIARRLGLSPRQVRYDLTLVRRRWRASAEAAAGEQLAASLARLEHLQQEAWERLGRLAPGDAASPQYLGLVLRVEERIARLLGLDAPAKIAPTDPTGTASYDGYHDTLQRRLAGLVLAQGAERLPGEPE